MKAKDLLDRAVKTLKASPAIDHWQKDREEIESEDLEATIDYVAESTVASKT